MYTEVIGIQLKTIFAISAILAFLPGLFAGTMRNKRSVDFSNPCNSAGGDKDLPEFDVIKNTLKEGTEGLKLDAGETKQMFGEGLPSDTTDTIDSSINFTFLNGFPQHTIELEIVNMEFLPAETLLRHWGHLYNISVLINRARTTGSIGKATTDDGSAFSNLRGKLGSLENKVYDIACDLATALEIKGVTELPTPAYTVPDIFDVIPSIYREMVRGYVLMKDVENVSGYLSAVYDGTP